MILRCLLLFCVTMKLNPEAAGPGGEGLMQLLTQLIEKMDDRAPFQTEFKNHIKEFKDHSIELRDHDKEFTSYKLSDDKRVNSLLVQVLSHSSEIRDLIKLTNEDQKQTARKRSEVDESLSAAKEKVLENANQINEIDEKFAEEKIATGNKLESVDSNLVQMKAKDDEVETAVEEIETKNTELSDALSALEEKYTELETKQHTKDMSLETMISSLSDTINRLRKQHVVDCPPGFTKLNSRCYYFSPFDGKETQEDAKTRCLALSSHLLTMQSAKENDIIKQHIKDIWARETSDQNYWYSLKRVGGQWRWDDGAGVITSFSDWHSGQGGGTLETSSCVTTYHPDADWKNNSPCSTKYGYICKI